MASYQNPYINPYTGYTPYVPTQPVAQPQPQQPQNGLIWVQGETGAKSCVLSPGATALLMDSEARKFYIKTVDASGIPMPLRTFVYDEVVATSADETSKPEYVTREEFEKKIAELTSVKKGKTKDE